MEQGEVPKCEPLRGRSWEKRVGLGLRGDEEWNIPGAISSSQNQILLEKKPLFANQHIENDKGSPALPGMEQWDCFKSTLQLTGHFN